MATLESLVPQIAFHPRVTLAEKLKEEGISVEECAKRTAESAETIAAVIEGKISVTPEMAEAFARVTKIPAYFWSKTQQVYDDYLVRQKREEQLALAYRWMESFPLTMMMKFGWVPKVRTDEKKLKALLSFFKLSSAKMWEGCYLNRQAETSLRISLSKTKEPCAISAWLRQGEIQAARFGVSAFSHETLRAIVPEMKELAFKQPAGFAKMLQKKCAKAGVKLVYTPCLPNAPIKGSTRWLNGVPCIQMADTYRNDVFWFTFFHELGHVLLHGKGDVFLELDDIEYTEYQQDKDKEKAADDFSYEVLLPAANEQEIINHGEFTK